MWAFPPKSLAVDLTEEERKPARDMLYKSYQEADRDNSQTASDRERIRGNILRPFNVPDFLNNETCTDLNGYFGCKGTYDKDEKLESYRTWFRCLVKMVLKVHEDDKNYKWYEMGFFTCWHHSGRCKVLCIDTPKDLPSKLMGVLELSPPDGRDPFAMHAPLIDQIVKLYDDSVWAIRDPIRKIEKTRQVAQPDFIDMHEISRHAVHISEVIAVTIDTIQNIQRQQKAVHDSLPAPGLDRTYREQAQEYMSFQLQMMKSLKMRSCSNYERLRSETVLAYNMLAKQDNNIIKSITVLTMTFLPATFISSFFSTTFFTFGDHSWRASKQLWVYWVTTLVSTLLVILVWRVWLLWPALNPFTLAFAFIERHWVKRRAAMPKGSGHIA